MVADTEEGSRWQLWVDTGGTFTDCIAIDPRGQTHRVKVLSSSSLRGTMGKQLDEKSFHVREQWDAPADFVRAFHFRLLGRPGSEGRVEAYEPESSLIRLESGLGVEVQEGTAFEVASSEEAPVLAARLATGTTAGRALPPMDMRLATTRGTNALLERRGAKLAFFVTRGFGDLLEIGTQQRPELFTLEVRKPRQLYSRVVEVPERVAADGRVIEPLRLDGMREAAVKLVSEGVTAAAVALVNSYRNPRHEQELAALLLKAGFVHVSCSAELAPLIKVLPRSQTAVVNAYLAPVIDAYLERVAQALSRGRLHVMTSAGGLVAASAYRPKDSLLSGPAGGVAGAAAAGRRSGFEKIISFDMGGTSTDVARFDGDYEYLFEHQVGDAHLVAPALAIESVAAGGGSVCSFDGAKLQVGPQSAGADPGPACYGAGGPLTLTDVNLLLGRLEAARFEIPVNAGAAERQLELLQQAVARQTGERARREGLLKAFLDIANERMADAIRGVSLRRGYDPRDYVLVAFGGAGAQHACGVADRLGVHTIIIPPEAGLLSAIGLGDAVVERFAERQVLRPLEQMGEELAEEMDELARAACRAVAAEGVSESEITIRRRILTCRFIGQESSLVVEYDEGTDPAKAFEQRYDSVFGYLPAGRTIEVEAARVVACSRREARQPDRRLSGQARRRSSRLAQVYFSGRWIEVAVIDRAKLAEGSTVTGPCLILEEHSAVVVEPQWDASVDRAGALVVRRRRSRRVTKGRRPEAAELELFTNRFRTVASEMGDLLQRTAVSTNVKERLDFSCALLDSRGELVVNAPHIPVHLGGLGLCVRRVIAALSLGPGDMVVTNHPEFGGSHLPDVTVVTPVYDEGNETLVGYVASRAHHAEIGGSRPGSMPPSASSLAEEGVVIAPCHILKGGKSRLQRVRQLLLEAPLPTRAIEENLADLRAAVAANQRGVSALRALVAAHGVSRVTSYMTKLKRYAERRLCRALENFPDGSYVAEERLDDGSPLRVTITVSGESACVDFAGSSAVHPGNLNATPAVVGAVVIYVLRLLLNEPIPLNDGLMRAVELRIPPGILNPPFPADPRLAPAVVGGNVETSQRLVDTLLKALGMAGCSQGTMNNLLFGTESYSYYETICGGCGAGPTFAGASAVHTHMTNTRITDCELIEHRYPVAVQRFSIRRGSGGAGKNPGGDGVVREILFHERMSLSLLSQHRSEGPYGLAGGHAGKPGAQRLIRKSGKVVSIGGIAAVEVWPGDRLVVETPGGGGWGPVG